MKKLTLALMIMLQMTAVSYGAVSGDVGEYVRKDLFEAYMKNFQATQERILDELKEIRQVQVEQGKAIAALSAKVDGNYASLSQRIDGNYVSQSQKIDGNYDALSQKIDGNYASLSNRIDGNYVSLSNRIDGLESRMDDFRNYLYLILVLLGIMVAFPSVQKFWQWKAEHQPSFTLEDVKRLIAENNAELLKTLKS
ncbi:MAG: hypothetical protein IJQ24_00320 [Synergistaceae bacterium]|nr:hypothetical protein [Synergistaceae bacterium]